MSTLDMRHHPAAEDLALFSEGKLSSSARRDVMAHVSACADCRLAVETAAEFGAQESGGESLPGVHTSDRAVRRWLPLAAAVVIAIALVPIARNWNRSRDPLVQLASAAPKEERAIEPRLSGFPHAEYRGSKRGPGDHVSDERHLFESLANQVFREAEQSKKPNAPHVMGVVYALQNHPGKAVEKLKVAAQRTPNDATVWNDMAAAAYASAVRDDSIPQLHAALEAAERAIALKNDFAEAHFNRALILQRLGMRPQAAESWRRYLELDPNSEWASEARRKLSDVTTTPRSDFKRELRDAIAAAERGDDGAALELVRARTQDARMWAEGPLLTQWAAAVQAGDAAEAARLLRGLHAIANALATETGNLLPLEMAESAERATGKDRQHLIEALLIYGDGRKLLADKKPTAAEERIGRAADLLGALRNPLAPLARYFQGIAVFEQNRTVDARRIWASLAASVDGRRHPAFSAQLDWQLAMADAYHGAWSSSLRHAANARRLFTDLNEGANAAFMAAIAADAHTYMGRIDEGWQVRVDAFEGLNRYGAAMRYAAALSGAVTAELRRGNFSNALRFASFAAEENRRAGETSLVVHSLLSRAVAFWQMGANDAAGSALDEARRAASSISDPQLRMRAQSDIHVTLGLLRQRENAPAAIDAFTRAIDFYRAGGESYAAWLPRPLLERGRARRSAGDESGALTDFEAGIRELEAQRAMVEQFDARSGFFDTAPELFAETIDLLLSRGENERALAMVERSRARTLVERLGANTSSAASLSDVQRALRPGEVIVEYAILPSGLAAFCIERRGLSVVRIDISPDTVRQLTLEFSDAIREHASIDIVERRGTAAWRALIEPVATFVDAADTLILVPDRFLSALPFAALYDPRSREHLIERHILTIAPSSSFLLRERAPFRTSPALIIGDPTADDPLPAARDEAKLLARSYAGATLLLGTNATRRAFLERASRSGLIHFAGHARRNESDSSGHLEFAGDPDQRALDATDIAQLDLHRTSLVVLAGCGTMRSRAEGVEGMPSLARAFLAAGVPTVLGTLWDVPDHSSSPLFRLFHQNLRSGASPASALARAQRSLLRSGNGGESHPAAWAATQMMGIG